MHFTNVSPLPSLLSPLPSPLSAFAFLCLQPCKVLAKLFLGSRSRLVSCVLLSHCFTVSLPSIRSQASRACIPPTLTPRPTKAVRVDFKATVMSRHSCPGLSYRFPLISLISISPSLHPLLSNS